MNVRRPKCFTPSMMSHRADSCVYGLWAGGRYECSAQEVLEMLNGRMLFHRMLPSVWSEAMGDEAFVLRHDRLTQVMADIERIQRMSDE